MIGILVGYWIKVEFKPKSVIRLEGVAGYVEA